MRCLISAKTSTHPPRPTAESDGAKVSRQQQQPGMKIKADILVVAERKHIKSTTMGETGETSRGRVATGLPVDRTVRRMQLLILHGDWHLVSSVRQYQRVSILKGKGASANIPDCIASKTTCHVPRSWQSAWYRGVFAVSLKTRFATARRVFYSGRLSPCL